MKSVVIILESKCEKKRVGSIQDTLLHIDYDFKFVGYTDDGYSEPIQSPPTRAGALVYLGIEPESADYGEGAYCCSKKF